MNKELYLSSAKTFSVFSKSQEEYATFLERLKSENTDTLSPSQLIEIRDMAKKRQEELENLKTEMFKLENKMHPERYKELMSSLENELALCSMLVTDCEKYLETQEPKYIESVVFGMQEEKEYSDKFNGAIATTERQFGTMIAGQALSGSMSLEEVRDLSESLEKGTPLQHNMEELFHTLERRNQKEPERVEQELEKPQVIKEEEKKEPTLQEKLNQINFSQAGNIVKEVQTLTTEDFLAQVAVQIDSLEKKEKLTLADMVALQSLKATELEMQTYMSSLENQKLTRGEQNRDKKMQKTTDRIAESQALLRQSQENYQKYDSKMMRFFSMRYQEQMQVKISQLQEKRGTLQDQQKMSAIAKFNKNSGKLVRHSRVIGTIRGMNQFRETKIEELKALRDQVITEFNAIKADTQRFKSNFGKVQELQQGTILMPDNIISLEEYRSMQQEMVA